MKGAILVALFALSALAQQDKAKEAGTMVIKASGCSDNGCAADVIETNAETKQPIAVHILCVYSSASCRGLAGGATYYYATLPTDFDTCSKLNYCGYTKPILIFADVKNPYDSAIYGHSHQ
jgi:hypothetical protein